MLRLERFKRRFWAHSFVFDEWQRDCKGKQSGTCSCWGVFLRKMRACGEHDRRIVEKFSKISNLKFCNLYISHLKYNYLRECIYIYLWIFICMCEILIWKLLTAKCQFSLRKTAERYESSSNWRFLYWRADNLQNTCIWKKWDTVHCSFYVTIP